MKLIYLTAMMAAILLAVPAFGQTVNTARIKFKGIGLDSTYAQVVKALGKPATDGPATEEGCIGAHEKSVEYPGVSFYMMDGDSNDGKTFEVKAFEVTAPGYVVSGVKIGDTPAAVRKKFGRKYTVETDGEPGEISWSYEMSDRYGPGTTSVVFKNGKVSMIASNYQVC